VKDHEAAGRKGLARGSAQGDGNGGRAHGQGVVRAVADKGRGALPQALLHDRHLLLDRQVAPDLVHAQLAAHPRAHLLPVAGQDLQRQALSSKLRQGRFRVLADAVRDEQAALGPSVHAEPDEHVTWIGGLGNEGVLEQGLRAHRERASARGGQAVRPRRLRWAGLLRRVLQVDALTCFKCSAAMVVIAFITDLKVCRKILEHLKLAVDCARDQAGASGGGVAHG
jgi:hypothetical protein